MLTNVFGIESNSGIQIAFHLGALLIFASLFSFLAIRLAMSLVSSNSVKARKQWDVEPAAGANETLIARLMSGCKDEPASQALLSNDIKRLIEQGGKRAPIAGPDGREQPIS